MSYQVSNKTPIDVENDNESTTLPERDYWYLESYIQDSNGNTELHHCMFNIHNYDRHAHQLIDSTWPPSLLDIRNNQGMTALHVGAIGSAFIRVRQLLVAGADPLSRDYSGCIPLHYACMASSIPMIATLTRSFDVYEITKMTLKNLSIPNLSDSIDIRNLKGETPLHIATDNGSLETVYILLSLGAQIDSLRYFDGRRPLEIAILKRHQNITQWFLNYYQKNPDDMTQIQYCCPKLWAPLKEMKLDQQFIETLRVPLHKLRPQQRSNRACTSAPEMNLVGPGPLWSTDPDLFLMYHADDHEGNTPLHKYMMNPFICESITQRLSKCSKAFLNAKNYYGMTPLHLGAMMNEPAKIRQLLIAGADPMISDVYGYTPLHYACAYGKPDNVSPFIKPFNAEEIALIKSRKLKIPDLSLGLKKTSNEGATPLCIAKRYENVQVVGLLQML